MMLTLSSSLFVYFLVLSLWIVYVMDEYILVLEMKNEIIIGVSYGADGSFFFSCKTRVGVKCTPWLLWRELFNACPSWRQDAVKSITIFQSVDKISIRSPIKSRPRIYNLLTSSTAINRILWTKSRISRLASLWYKTYMNSTWVRRL